MNYRLLFLLAAFGLSAIMFVVFATGRRPYRFLLHLLLTAFSISASAQNWSSFLDSSRAVDWSNAGFTIPNYTNNCSVQPTLTPNSTSAASANATAIQNALASCDATHNVVNISTGTFYVAGFHYGMQGKQVLRGAGAGSTKLISTSEDGCAGQGHGVCMLASDWTYSADASVLTGGSRQCLWSAGYSKGTTTITLSSCGGTPPAGKTLVLDQANDTSDTGGVYMCNSQTTRCTYDPASDANGRIFTDTAHQHSMQQVVLMKSVTSLGGGSYSVTISPGVYSTNIRSSQSPGAWWPGFVQNDGIENLSIDGAADSAHGTLSMFSCYQCWVKGVTFLNGARNSVFIYQSSHDVIRDSYFFGAQSSHSESYNIESGISSDFLIENNIMQQVTTPLLINGGTMGAVVDYNYAIKMIYTDATWAWPVFSSHAPGSNFNLFEGNVGNGIDADNSSGPSDQITAFRNMYTGWEAGTTNATVPFIIRANSRNFNFVGNVLGQPGYHTSYQIRATGTSTYSGGPEDASIYSLGLGGGDTCSILNAICDPLVYTTAMRWGNYDVVTAGVKWDSTEASSAANTFVNANFTSSYFGSLAHTLPASLYYSSIPSWWTSAKNWPPIGPDVSSGNVGVCTGTYGGSQGTNSSQCIGGTLTAAWASHVTSIPAQDCYLSTMGGPPNGSGSALSFNAGKCYPPSGTTTGSTPGSPNALTATVL